MKITATVPGKVMLAGEYAVLDGGRAIAMALDGRLEVQCSVSFANANPAKTRITLTSDLWPQPVSFELPEGRPEVGVATPFVDAAIAALDFFEQKPATLEFSARGNLDPALGAGSSSALRLATLAAAERAANSTKATDLDAIESLAVNLQRLTQPAASGYDVAIQRRGGGIVFCAGQSTVIPARDLERLTNHVAIIAGGRGAPTGATMREFLGWLTPARKARLMSLSEAQVDAWLAFMEGKTDLTPLVTTIAAHRTFMADSPVFPHGPAKILDQVPGVDRTWTWKPTGAGGEDSLLLIGPAEDMNPAISAMTPSGWQPSTMGFCREGLQLC